MKRKWGEQITYRPCKEEWNRSTSSNEYEGKEGG